MVQKVNPKIKAQRDSIQNFCFVFPSLLLEEDEQEMGSNDEIDSGEEASVSESDADGSISDIKETEPTTGNDNIIYGNFGW